MKGQWNITIILLALLWVMHSKADEASVIYQRLKDCRIQLQSADLRGHCIEEIMTENVVSVIDQLFKLMLADKSAEASANNTFILHYLRQGHDYDRSRELSRKVLFEHVDFIKKNNFLFRNYLRLSFVPELPISDQMRACVLSPDVDCFDPEVLKGMTAKERSGFVDVVMTKLSGQFVDMFSLARLLAPFDFKESGDFFGACITYHRDQTEGRSQLRQFIKTNPNLRCGYQMMQVLRLAGLGDEISTCRTQGN